MKERTGDPGANSSARGTREKFLAGRAASLEGSAILNGSRVYLSGPMDFVASRAAELRWPDRSQPNGNSNFFARCLMMPAVWIQENNADAAPLEDLATRFGVPVQMAAQRLNEIKQSNVNTPRPTPKRS